MEKILNFAMMVFAIIAYLIILYGILFKKTKTNFVTWFLWTILDAIAFYGTLQKNEDITLVMIFTIGSGLITLVLLLKRQFTWGNIEIATCILVATCLVISYLGNSDVVIWSSSISVFIAGVPYLIFLKTAPEIDGSVKIIVTLFMAVSVIALSLTAMAGMNTIFPVACSLYWIIAAYLGFKEYGKTIKKSLTN